MRRTFCHRYQQLFGVTPGGKKLHIGRIYYEPQTDCSGAAPAQAGGMCDIRVLAGRRAPEPAPQCRFFFALRRPLGQLCAPRRK